jgi:hypothetical protein
MTAAVVVLSVLCAVLATVLVVAGVRMSRLGQQRDGALAALAAAQEKPRCRGKRRDGSDCQTTVGLVGGFCGRHREAGTIKV